MLLVFTTEPSSSLALNLQWEGNSRCDQESIPQRGNKQKYASSTLHLDSYSDSVGIEFLVCDQPVAHCKYY